MIKMIVVVNHLMKYLKKINERLRVSNIIYIIFLFIILAVFCSIILWINNFNNNNILLLSLFIGEFLSYDTNSIIFYYSKYKRYIFS